MSHPRQPQADLERKEILESRIGLALIEIAPPGWYLVDLRGSMTAETQQLRLAVVLEDGREAAASELDADVQRRIIEAMAELRQMHFRPESGTWFSMRLSAKHDSYSVAYDFYHEPPWEPPLEPAMYLRDYETFPRDIMHLPIWLRDKLREAQPGRFTGSFSIVGRMNLEDQRDWADEAAALLAQSLPAGNHQTTIYYQAMGDHVDMSADVLNVRMREVAWEPPAKLLDLLKKLREGMYEQGAGTWFGVRLQVQGISHISLEFNYDSEPKWEVAPPESAYREELELYPRALEVTPYWLARRAGLTSGPELSVAKPYDAALPFPDYPNGYPTFTDRPTLADEERDGLSAYLENAPVVLTQEGGDPDLFDRTGATRIPREYRTDGSWVWPASVSYYLRAHRVAPERGLVEHIRSRGFQVPDVDQGTRDAAVAAIRGGSA
ncbi:MAG: hypothetical protein JWR24_3515 [Actinoallomurus sp.]|nr:hypothetical protein [Actinoallomurus sp.]